ncbi:MAG TPA: branched-chain amino acid ABC transporter permease [Candidatus Limnocylindrales bacterium]|nr:branched-chain amino acid ABC transporter permease [Candidatus Limnocylindrales bacterium]
MTTTVAVPRPNALNRAARIVLFAVLAIVVYAIVLWVALQQSWLTGSDALPSNQAFGVAIQQTINALSIGAIYALIALGYTMVYGIIELINFAHGDVFMVSAFLAMGVTVVIFGQVPGSDITNIPFLILVLAVALLLVMPATGLLNMAIERVFYRPFRGGNRLAPLITAVGVSFILQNVALVLIGSGDRAAPQVFPLNWQIPLGSANVSVLSIFIFVLAVTLMFGLNLFVSRTRLGRAMRATAQDQQAASLMGVDLNQTIALTFLLGGALAGAAGVVWGLRFGFVRQDLGFNAGLKAFTSAVLGGIGNINGAALGGFFIGFTENLASALGFSRWSEFLVFLILTFVLIFRPTGILGQQLGDRA